MITFKEYFLISIRPNKLRVENLKTGDFLESEEGLTFGNERLLITDIYEPDETLKDLVNRLSSSSIFILSKTYIINPYHPNIPVFTEVEKRAFRDMAEHGGATSVYFIFGEGVTSNQIDLRYLSSQLET